MCWWCTRGRGCGGSWRGVRLVLAAGARFVLGPEQLDQHLARMGALAVVSQVGEQSSCLVGLEAGDEPVVPVLPQATQEFNAPWCIHFAFRWPGRRLQGCV